MTGRLSQGQIIAAVGAILVVTLAYSGSSDWFDDPASLGVYGANGSDGKVVA